MLLDFLRSFRDYCYNETKHSKDEAYAESKYWLLFGLGLLFYYFTILAIVLLLLGRIGLKPSVLLVNYFAIAIFYAVILIFIAYVPYILLKRIARHPINKKWTPEQLKKLRPIYILFMLFGPLIMVGILRGLTILVYE